MKKRVFISILCLIFVLAGCGSSDAGRNDSGSYKAVESAEVYDADSEFSSGYSADYDYAAEDMADVEPEEYNGSSGASDHLTEEQVEDYGSKIIRNASISLEVNSLEAFADNLKKTVSDYNGYIESMDINAYDSDYSESRFGYFTVRIPASRLDDFLSIVKDEGVVTAKSESAEDVTLQYVDIEARIATYEAERDSLMELLDKATSLKDILTIRDKIAEVNYELDSLNRQIKSMQNKVSYSTVSVDAKETRTIAGSKGEKSYWSKIGENFASELEDGLEIAIDLIIFIVTRIPLFLILALILFVIVKIIKAIFGKSGKEKKEKKTRQKKNNAPAAAAQPPVQPAVPEPAPAPAQAIDTSAPQAGGHYTSNVPPVPGTDENNNDPS